MQELYRHHSELVATLILVDTYAGWKGSLPEEEVRARVDDTYQALMVPAEKFDPTRALPGWFAGDPPAEFVPLLEDVTAAVRPESMRTALTVMAETDQRDLLPRITVPTLLIWGELDAFAAQRRTPVRAGDPGHETHRDPRRRPRQQPRAAGAVQPGRARVLSRPPPALALKPAAVQA